MECSVAVGPIFATVVRLPFQYSGTFPSHKCVLTRHDILRHAQSMAHDSRILGWFGPLFLYPAGMSPHPPFDWEKFQGAGNWVKWRGSAVAERGPAAMLHSVTSALRNSPNSVYGSLPTALLWISVFPRVVAVRPWCHWAWSFALWSHRAWCSCVYRPICASTRRLHITSRCIAQQLSALEMSWNDVVRCTEQTNLGPATVYLWVG